MPPPAGRAIRCYLFAPRYEKPARQNGYPLLSLAGLRAWLKDAERNGTHYQWIPLRAQYLRDKPTAALNHFLQDIEITNFKSIRHQKIEECRRINVFIGYPNVGKSNILEALAMLSYVDAGQAEITSLSRLQNTIELFFDGNFTDPANIKFNGSGQVSISYETEKAVSIYYQGFVDSLNQFSSIRAFRAPLDSQAGETPLDRISTTLVNGQNTPKPSVKKYVFNAGQDWHEKGYDSLFFPRGQNLFYILERDAKLRKDMATLLEQYGLKLAIEKGDKYRMRVLKTLPDDTIFLLPFHLVADTLQRLIFYKAAVATNENTTLLFEEPEAHMFPPYIKLFTNDIIDQKSNQYFLTTHSPFVLHEFLEKDSVREELSIYTVGLENGETTIKRLTDEEVAEVHQHGVDLFFNLESYL